MARRTVILHYHLFKNAGTSVDRILKDNFPDRWVTREFPGRNNTAQVMEWIKETPEAVAFSSHTMMGPLPRLPGVDIITIMMLRNPIDRIRSAYRFERNQQSENFGAVLARHTDFEGYVRVRLALPADRQCRNFQTWRLASLVPGAEPELDRAKQALDALGVVGRVEAFDAFLAGLKTCLAGPFPDFDPGDGVRMNVSKPAVGDVKAPEVHTLLQGENEDDLELLKTLQRAAEQA